MSFVDRVLTLLEVKGISRNKMLTDLNLSKNSFVDWTNRGNIPAGDVLVKISNYLNVSVDYLLGNETKKENPSLTRDEFEEKALELFRKLSFEEKKAFLQFMQARNANRGESK